MRFDLLHVPIWFIISRIEGSHSFDGMTKYYQRDVCNATDWQEALHTLKHAFKSSNPGEVLTHFRKSGILERLSDPVQSLECATGAASLSLVIAECFERLGDGVRALRARQAASIYLSFDFQMKGQEWIEKSAWGISWLETVDKVLRSMLWFSALDGYREKSMPELLRSMKLDKGLKRLKIAIVTVCDYDETVTPLGELSIRNKKTYASKNGYEVMSFNKAPEYLDFVTRSSEMYSPRPAAWSKIDAMLLALTDESRGDFDWVMWMDCDSYFMDMETRLEQVIQIAEARHEKATGIKQPLLLESKKTVNSFKRWTHNQQSNISDLEAFNGMLREAVGIEVSTSKCPGSPPSNKDPIFSNCQLHVIASEDGLMLNTGVFFVRKSVMSFYFLHRVKQLLFGKTAVTFHPWWEQTGIMQLISIPLTFADDHLWKAVEWNKGFAPFIQLMSQKQLNGYPPLIAGMLKTHSVFEEGKDFIVSFSGCKIYSSQSVCNHLFIQYFLKGATLGEGAIPEVIKKFTE